MTYGEAMAAIHRKATVVVGRAGMRLSWRFGRPMVLLDEGPHRLRDYTPTREDMLATDWSQE